MLWRYLLCCRLASSGFAFFRHIIIIPLIVRDLSDFFILGECVIIVIMKVLWTDGSASPNPGPGGWAVIENEKPVRLGREAQTTNIRMEGAALKAAMEYAGTEGCEIHTDSQFWVNVLTKWADGWRHQDFATGKVVWSKRGGEIQNLEMVKELYELYHKLPVELVFVRGHMGTYGNELADEWANKAREGATVEE